MDEILNTVTSYHEVQTGPVICGSLTDAAFIEKTLIELCK